MQLVPVKFFKSKQSVATKPIPIERSALNGTGAANGAGSTSNGSGAANGAGSGADMPEDGFLCCGYTSQAVIDKIWGPLEGWLRSGMKGSLMLHLQGLALSVDPSQVTKNSLKAKRLAIPKPVAPLFSIPEEPRAPGKTGNDAGTTELKIDSSVPFSVKVEQTEKNGQKSTITEYHSSRSSPSTSSSPSASSSLVGQFIDSEAVEVGDELEEGDVIRRKQKRKRRVRFAPARKALGSDGEEMGSDSEWEDCEEGQVKDDDSESIKEFLDDEEVISCNNQAEAEMVLNRKKMAKREHYNNSNGKKSLSASIHSITSNVEKAKMKMKGQLRGTAEGDLPNHPRPRVIEQSSSPGFNEEALNSALAECRKQQQQQQPSSSGPSGRPVQDDDTDYDNDNDNDNDNDKKGKGKGKYFPDDEVYVSDEEGEGEWKGWGFPERVSKGMGHGDVDYRKKNLNDDFIPSSQSIE